MINLIKIFITFFKKLFSTDLRINYIDINYLIIDSENILKVNTHNWDKKYIDTAKLDRCNIHCTVCNVQISEALWCNEEKSLNCEEQQIKNILE